MSFGPVSNSTNTSRLNQTQRLQETQRNETPTATTPAAAADAVERTAVDPALQAGAREATKGIEDAIKGRLEQATEGAAGGSAPRRGLNSLEGEQYVGRRTGKGRRTANNETGGAGVDRPQLARAASDAPSAQDPIQLAGKRTTVGTRVGLGDDAPPLPGMPPSTEFV